MIHNFFEIFYQFPEKNSSHAVDAPNMIDDSSYTMSRFRQNAKRNIAHVLEKNE